MGRRYRLIDITSGWIMFLVASVVYLLTLEPTGSFWDCGEFIACGHKLIVGHPPGAPFFMLLMRMFTMFAPTPEQVGVFANAMSAFASGATIMFLYWSIAHLARRWILRGEDRGLTPWEIVLVVGASVVGSLAYTFSDTFWFSAVEGEVYALSSLFTAVVFWAILKWEEDNTSPHRNRWIVLIAYLMGLSIGVHLLNLLVIPAIVLVYYFKNYRFTWLGLVKALVISAGLLLAVLYGVIQGLVVVASWFELLFVNVLGLPIMTGAVVFFLLLGGVTLLLIRFTQRRRKYMANLLLVCFGMILVGYSSYSVIVVRSMAKPTLDQGGVNNVYTLKSYLNREQYGSRPLLMGPYFNAPVVGNQDGANVYGVRGGRYEVVSQKSEPEYDPRFVTIFPRMYSTQSHHQAGYKAWVDIEGTPVDVTDRDGTQRTLVVPSFGENLQFFFRYQLGHMYWRYFMWNFAGRQNDFQGYGHDAFRGNWISGIPFIDTPRLGPQESIPEPYRSNKARNRYFMLPLLLGLVGMFGQFSHRSRDASIVFTLFFMTGIAIIMYLNQAPYEPRERDYTFAGSFYAFAIWVGLGVVPLAQLLRRGLGRQVGTSIAVVASFLCVPLLMGTQNWDDHDRSGRYISVDFARNMLSSVAPDGILFTYADNDTFPLWYAQEAEGFREDVRICNLTYLSGSWYVDEMSRKAYSGEPIPFNLKEEDYADGINDLVLINRAMGRPVDLRAAIDFVKSPDPRTKQKSPYVGLERISYLPSAELTVPVDTAYMQTKVQPAFRHRLENPAILRPQGSFIYKNGFAMYAFLAHNNWERDFYYSPLLPRDMYWDLDKYFVRQGLVSQVLPVRDLGEFSMIDTATLYDNLMRKFSFRSINDPEVYVDETCKRMINYYFDGFTSGITAYLKGGMLSRAEELADRCLEVLPPEAVGWSYYSLQLIDAYYRVGAEEKARDVLMRYAEECLDMLHFIQRLPEHMAPSAGQEQRMAAGTLQRLLQIAEAHGDKESTQTLANLWGQL